MTLKISLKGGGTETIGHVQSFYHNEISLIIHSIYRGVMRVTWVYSIRDVDQVVSM